MKKELAAIALSMMLTTTAFAAHDKKVEQSKPSTVIEYSQMEAAHNVELLHTESQNTVRPKVVVFYVNNAKTTYDDKVDESVLGALGKDMPADKYQLLNGEDYTAQLSAFGIEDISVAERADIVDALADEDIDYAVFLEVEPFVSREKITVFTYGKELSTSVPFKIIDLVNGRYLYNGKFTEKVSDSTMFGDIGNKSVSLKVLKKINSEIASVIAQRLPKTRATKIVKPAK